MINVLTVAAVSALAISTQDISATTDLEIEAPVDLTAEQTVDVELTGEILKTDLEVIAKTEFEAADANGDMTVTEEEFVTAGLEAEGAIDPMAEVLEGEIKGEIDGDMATEEVQPTAAEYLRTRFAAISQGDGELTGVELETALEEEFAAADEDGDEILTGAEVQTFASLRKGKTNLQ